MRAPRPTTSITARYTISTTTIPSTVSSVGLSQATSTTNAIAAPMPRSTGVYEPTNVAAGPGAGTVPSAVVFRGLPVNHATAAITSASTTTMIADARRNEVIWSHTAPAADFGSFLLVMASR